jgi:hypothetical protein
MSAISPLGGLEWALLAMLFGIGWPLGMPPEKEDPVIAYAAPSECLYYANWAGMATPNPASGNRTEQLLAEPELQQFVATVEKAFAIAIASMPRDGEDPERTARLAKSAPLWTRTLLTRPAALFVTKFAPEANGITVEAGVIVRAGDAAGPLHTALTELLTTEANQPAEVTIAGRKFLTLAGGLGRPFEIQWGVSNGYLMIGVGEGAMKGLIARLAAQQEPAWLKQLKTNLPVPQRSSLSYINVKQLCDTFAPLGGPQADGFVAALGLRQVTALQSSSGLDETGIVNRSLLAYTGPPRGLLTLAEGSGLVAADLKHIPTDALVATCVSLDARKALETLLSALGEVDPKAGASAEDGLAQVAEQFGIDIRASVAALGSRWSLHAAAADGGWLGAAATIEVRDRRQLLQAQDSLLAKLLPPNAPQAVGQIVHPPFAGQTITQFAPRDPQLAFLAPSWCVTDKQLVFGLNPQAVKSVLLRQPGEKSLAELPEVAALLSGKEPLLSLSYCDTPKLFEATYPLAQILLPMATRSLNEAGISIDVSAVQLPTPRTISKHLLPSISVVRRTRLGIEMEARQTLPGMSMGASAPVAVALLLPAVQAARSAASRTQGANNLKQQLLALHNYHDVYGGMPAAYSTDKAGKPLLSWRVAILPFIEEQALYEEFRQDEPWDSDHNKKLLAKMPRVFKATGSKAAPGMTTYLGVGGKQGVLGAPDDPKNPEAPNGVRLADIIDGTSNTIAIVEASDAAAVAWTKPEQWVPDEKDPHKGLVGLRPNGFNAGFADGSVRFISKNVNAETLKLLFMRDDGMPVDLK